MAFPNEIKNDSASTANTGFGTNASSYGGRLLNIDGTPNIEKRGIGYFQRTSWFHSMLSISGWRFFLIILFFYIRKTKLFQHFLFFIF